jgi:hypothetical protein
MQGLSREERGYELCPECGGGRFVWYDHNLLTSGTCDAKGEVKIKEEGGIKCQQKA